MVVANGGGLFTLWWGVWSSWLYRYLVCVIHQLQKHRLHQQGFQPALAHQQQAARAPVTMDRLGKHRSYEVFEAKPVALWLYLAFILVRMSSDATGHITVS